MARSSSIDPLEKFRFLVSWSSDTGSEVTATPRAGFHDAQAPKRTTTKGTYREGVDPDIKQLFAGLTSMEDVVLSRGLVAHDANNELYKWMSAVHNPQPGHPGLGKARPAQAAAADYRKDVTIKLLDRSGNVAREWVLYNAFPVHFTPGSDMNAGEDTEKSIESVTLAYEDFQEIDVTAKAAADVSSSL